jgi:hypothetical protein
MASTASRKPLPPEAIGVLAGVLEGPYGGLFTGGPVLAQARLAGGLLLRPGVAHGRDAGKPAPPGPLDRAGRLGAVAAGAVVQGPGSPGLRGGRTPLPLPLAGPPWGWCWRRWPESGGTRALRLAAWPWPGLGFTGPRAFFCPWEPGGWRGSRGGRGAASGGWTCRASCTERPCSSGTWRPRPWGGDERQGPGAPWALPGGGALPAPGPGLLALQKGGGPPRGRRLRRGGPEAVPDRLQGEGGLAQRGALWGAGGAPHGGGDAGAEPLPPGRGRPRGGARPAVAGPGRSWCGTPRRP